MSEEVIEELIEELESKPGGHDHIWFEVDCPTCEVPMHTHCVSDPAETPPAIYEYDGTETIHDGEKYSKYFYDKPCAKRVLKAVIEMMEEAGNEEDHRLADAEPRHQPDSDND